MTKVLGKPLVVKIGSGAIDELGRNQVQCRFINLEMWVAAGN